MDSEREVTERKRRTRLRFDS